MNDLSVLFRTASARNSASAAASVQGGGRSIAAARRIAAGISASTIAARDA